MLAGIAAAGDNDDLMMITNEGQIVRTPASGLRLCGRVSQGVIAMRLRAGQSIVFVAVVPHEETQDNTTDATGLDADEPLPQEAVQTADEDEEML